MAVTDGTILKCVATIVMPSSVIAQNVFYVKLNTAAPWDDALLMNEIGDYVDAIYANMTADMDAGCSLQDVVTHEWDWNAVTSKWETGRYVGLDSLIEVPAFVGDMLPHAVAAVITGFSEDVNARSRKSFPGFGDTKQLESSWVAATVVNLVGAGMDWLALYALGGVDSLQAVVPTKEGVALALISYLVSAIIGSQRQRKPGEGI